ncbi:Glycosyltransferase involved in cell wall bisynthesis [Anaerobium acetethylicum]|uniref:Glycosyltransferase involved in cell wall bisynthesis n=2 Tax=Anaerobium acetethylicum TaxID=1619234 RepID=A0A1D3TR97_9FIRM|nr:Glycosyltransferase involved in cell wall bisynthesis [Anaerobium acetethylicum]
MISSKNDFDEYLILDNVANGNRKTIVTKWQKLYRKYEYYRNCKCTYIFYPYIYFLKKRFESLSIKLGFSIPINVFGSGLSIAHYGTIVVNGNARVGKNCRIQEGVTIGATNGETAAPIFGDNVFIGSGAKIIGNIKIANDVCIGAGSVVVKDILEEGITVAGVPAKKISNKNSHSNLNAALFQDLNMKICFFSGNITRTGGTERVSLLIANELASRGYDISILSYENGEKATFEKEKEINLYSLHMENAKGKIKRKVFPYIRLLKFLKKEKPDVLIDIDVLLCLYSLPLKLFCKVKMIAWEHFNFSSNNGVKNRDRARVLAAKYADKIIVLTKADLEEYKKNLKIKHSIDYIYNPTVGDSAKVNFDLRENVVIASGRLAYQKNFLELLEIWNEIEANHSDWKLIICGSGEEEAELKGYVNKQQLKNVVFAGFVKNIENYYNKSKIMVMTSRFEGFPMVLLEGQKAGLPIISYDCFTGPSEIVIDGNDGFLIEQGDKETFVRKLDELMSNEVELTSFSENAYQDSRRFNIDKIVDKWEEILGNG